MKLRKTLSVLLSGALILGLPAGMLYAEDASASGGGAMLQNPTASEQSGEAAKVEFSFETPEAMLEAMKRVSENDRFALYYSKENMAVALLEKQSGRIYSTNPYNASLDSGSVGNTEKLLESQVVLSYIDANERQQKLDLFSSGDCVELGQFSYTEYADGVSFSLSVGKETGSQLVPPALTEARFNELTGQLEGRPARRMKGFYTRYSLEDDLSEGDKAALIAEYPGIENGAVYAALNLSEREMKEVEGYLKGLNYTAADLQKDLEAVGVKREETHSPNFRFRLEYVLTEDGLVVNIPNESIVYEHQYYQLLSLRLLPFFGCDTPKQGGEGYLFFPDGSGSIIEMDGPRENRRLITVPVYGFDAGDEPDVDIRAEEPCYLPVFGIHRNDAGSVFAVIESGDEVASITAQLGEPNGSYYTVYSTFTIANEKHILRDAKVSSLGSQQMVYLFERGRTPYSGDLSIRYHILPEENSGYSGMAECYRAYLMSRGMTEKELRTLGVAVETIGTALYPADFLGFTYKGQAKFTAYEQNILMAQELLDDGVRNLTLHLSGWQKNGLDSGVSNKVRLSGALGGKAGFRKLLDFAQNNEVLLYPDADLLFATTDRLFDGFSANSNGIRQLDYTLGGAAEYEPDIDDFGKLRTGVSPERYPAYFRSFFKSYSSYGLSTVSLGSAGSYLNSDYHRKHSFNRGRTRDVLEELLKEYSQEYTMSFSGANAYALPYASRLCDIAMTDSGYLERSYSIPFVQMVVSGCMVTQSPPINLEQDMKQQLLRCIESGTMPSFVVCCDNIELLKKTDYSRYYSIHFKVQKKNILQAYQQYTEALAAAGYSRMISHEKLADGVFVSGYENGTKIYVNYNDKAFSLEGLTVEAENFAAVPGYAERQTEGERS